jgi:hypothetical protein
VLRVANNWTHGPLICKKVAATSSRITKIRVGLVILPLKALRSHLLASPIKLMFCGLSPLYKIGAIWLHPDFVTQNVYLTLGFTIKNCSKFFSFEYVVYCSMTLTPPPSNGLAFCCTNVILLLSRLILVMIQTNCLETKSRKTETCNWPKLCDVAPSFTV